jgi:nucleoside-diphosphate-sugar epimerase
MNLYPEEYLALASKYLESNSVDFSGSKILITGASGFVGSWTIDLIRFYAKSQSQEVEILGLSRNLKATSRKLGTENFEYLKWVEGGVDKISEIDFKFTHAIHAATPTTIETGAKDAQNVIFSTERGMDFLIEKAKINGNKPRILHTSSGAVYGSSQTANESFLLVQDISKVKYDRESRHFQYSITKNKTESKLNVATSEGWISGLNARLFAFYGHGLPTKSHYAIGNLVDQAINSQTLTLNGNGQAVRSYQSGNEMAALILYVLTSNLEGATHIGSDQGNTLKFWADLVGDAAGKEVELLAKFDDSADRYVAGADLRVPAYFEKLDSRKVLTDWMNLLKSS